MSIKKKTLGIYISRYNIIGGVEKFVFNFTKRMSKHYDILFLFDWVEYQNSLFEINKFSSVEKIDYKKIYKFDYFVNSTAWGFSPYNNIQAEKVIQVVHADYRHVIENWNFKYKKHEKVTHHVCVGEIVKEGFETVTGLKCDSIIYNLLDNEIILHDKPKHDKLTLITCSRISGEKGFDRMLKFADILDQNKIDYVWNIYSNNAHAYAQQVIKQFKDKKKVNFKGVTTDPLTEIRKHDYLVQLSDTEGFAYSVYEALQTKTPCLITPFASGNEQIQHGINGYILPFDLKDVNLSEIINKIPVVDSFEELGKEEDWINLFENGKDKKRIV